MRNQIKYQRLPAINLLYLVSNKFNSTISNNIILVAASSQATESVNNMIAHKAPKNICYSRTASANFRVASAVCSKNDGESSIVNIKQKILLSPGKYTRNHILTTEKYKR